MTLSLTNTNKQQKHSSFQIKLIIKDNDDQAAYSLPIWNTGGWYIDKLTHPCPALPISVFFKIAWQINTPQDMQIFSRPKFEGPL